MPPTAAHKHVCQWLWGRCWATLWSRLAALGKDHALWVPSTRGGNITYKPCFHLRAEDLLQKKTLLMPQVERMEGTKLLGKLLAGVWIAWTQGSCSSGSLESAVTL